MAKGKRDADRKNKAPARQRAISKLGLPLLAAAVVLVSTKSGLADRWELPFRDLLLTITPKRPPQFTVAVVVDEASLARFGRFQ